MTVLRRGTVVAFDEDRGLGSVEDAQGERLGFHCTSVADGSRWIATGTVVGYEVVAGHRGHYEARNLRPV